MFYFYLNLKLKKELDEDVLEAGVQFFRANLLGSVLHGELMVRSCQGQGSFTNSISKNLKTASLKMFANREDICTCRQNPEHSRELWKYLFWKLFVKSFKKLFHVQPEIDILFVKLSPQIVSCFWKIASAHCASGIWDSMKHQFFCNTLKGDLYIDVLMTELF